MRQRNGGICADMDLNLAALAGKVDLKRVVVNDKTEDIPYE